jgi:hypothetical protein
MSFNFLTSTRAKFDADSMREKLFGQPRQNLGLRPNVLVPSDRPTAPADYRPAKSIRRKTARLRKSAVTGEQPVDQTSASDAVRRRLPVEYLGHLISNEQQSDGKWIASFVRMGGDLENARRSASHPASHMAFADAKRQIDAALADPAIGQREFQRMPVALDGMIFIAKDAHECQLLDLSGGGARLRLATPASVEGDMTLYIQGFGRFRAVIARSADLELSVRFVSDEETMLALLKGLSSYVQGFDAPLTKLRKEIRVAASIPAVCRDSDGTAIPCQIINASMRSMSIRMSERPRIGSLVMLGKTKVRVMRHHDQGIAVQCLPAPSAKTSRFNLKEEE